MWNVRWIVAFVLLLAACGGGGDDSTDVPPSPTDNPNLGVQPTQVLSETEIAEGIEPAVEESFEEQINSLLAEQPQQAPLPTSTPDGEGALPLPQPQTLVAAETEEASIPPGFDYIYFEQTGGLENTNIIIELSRDGTVTVDGGDPVRGDAATLAQIAQLITDINFFGLQGNFLSGVPAGEDTYRYRLAVVSGEWERAIQAQEGYMPEEIVRLLGLIRQVGDNAAQS